MSEPVARPLRSLIEEPSYAAACEQLGSVQRCDEMALAITWRISRAAESFPEIQGTHFRLARAREFQGKPVLRVYFTINSADECSLWWIDQVPDPGISDEAEAV